MSTTSVQTREAAISPEPGTAGNTSSAHGAIAWSSFLFATLQSICTFFGAANGLRLFIGLGAITLSSTTAAFVREFHSSWFRRPMNGLALAGAILNLIVLWQVRRLRQRPAAQWRQVPVTAKKLRSERLQLVLSIATLVLVTVEETIHFLQHGHL